MANTKRLTPEEQAAEQARRAQLDDLAPEAQAPAPAQVPAQISDGSTLDLVEGALYELTAHSGLAMEKLAYVALAIAPNLDRELLAQVCGRTVAAVRNYERTLTELHMLDPDTRTVLYPRTGSAA